MEHAYQFCMVISIGFAGLILGSLLFFALFAIYKLWEYQDENKDE